MGRKWCCCLFFYRIHYLGQNNICNVSPLKGQSISVCVLHLKPLLAPIVSVLNSLHAATLIKRAYGQHMWHGQQKANKSWKD